MPEIGPLEILVIAVVALIVFGPEKLPEMGRKVGIFLANVRRMSNDMRSEFTGWMDDEDDDPFTPEDETSTAASRADEKTVSQVKNDASRDEKAASRAENNASPPEGEPAGEGSDAAVDSQTRPARVDG